MENNFLNVDLEIESTEDLQGIINDLGDDVSVLHQGENASGFHVASFELKDLVFERDADAVIATFCNLIENLSLESKSIWEKCHSKRFDAGFESVGATQSYQTELRSDTITKVAGLGASIVITIYPNGV